MDELGKPREFLHQTGPLSERSNARRVGPGHTVRGWVFTALAWLARRRRMRWKAETRKSLIGQNQNGNFWISLVAPSKRGTTKSATNAKRRQAEALEKGSDQIFRCQTNLFDVYMPFMVSLGDWFILNPVDYRPIAAVVHTRRSASQLVFRF